MVNDILDEKMKNKLQLFMKLKGSDLNNASIQKEKLKYLFYRLIEPLILEKNMFTMGNTLMKSTIVDNGYGLFICREKCPDLHIISGSYEFEVRRVFEELAERSKVIVDVGSHIGKYTILGSKINSDAEVFSIEADEDNFSILNKNLSLNNIKNVNPIKIALGNRKGREKFYRYRIGIHNPTNEWERRKESFKMVKTDTLDNLFKNKEIDLIKIDVDGSEINILEGGKKLFSQKKIKNIIIEITGHTCYEEVSQFFKKYGYKLRKVQYDNYLADF